MSTLTFKTTNSFRTFGQVKIYTKQLHPEVVNEPLRTQSKSLFCFACIINRKYTKMTDKKKNFALPSAPISKTAKIKRPSTVTSGVASSSSLNRPKTGATTTIKEKASVSQPRSKFNKNTTIVSGDADTTVIGKESFPNFDGEYRQIAYGNYLRAMLEECMVDDKIEREETYMDLQMAQLADRFQKTTELLDQTNKRLKDMSFVVEQKRLLDMKNQDCCLFYETSDSSNAHNILQSLSNTQQASLDKLDTKNIDFGFNKNSGHQQLLDAVNDAIDGLEQIKKHSDLDVNKFNEYKTSHDTWTEVEKERFDLESLKRDFDVDFPKLNEKLLKEATAKIALMIENEEEVDDRVMTALTASLKCGAGASARIGTELSRQLDMWLSKADLTHGPARAIIAPHAGYSYCGSCSAFAYRQISPVVVKRIFILGPSHHVRLNGCALSSMDKYQTPLYDLTIDKQIYTELEATRQFEWMDVQTDEDEHSIEMHLPYIAKVMEEYKTGFTIIPILVGSISPDKEAKYGAILAPYLADPQNLFIISSDFCHWGSRFRYTWCERDQPIYQSIEWLDKQGMNIIEKLDPKPFTDYLNKYGNTICGRHPIGVLLQAVTKLQAQSNAPKMSMKFLKYAQSSQCMSKQDSSVSYASASLCFE